MQDVPAIKDIWLIRWLVVLDDTIKSSEQSGYPNSTDTSFQMKDFPVPRHWWSLACTTSWHKKKTKECTVNNALPWGMASLCQPQASCQCYHGYSYIGGHPEPLTVKAPFILKRERRLCFSLGLHELCWRWTEPVKPSICELTGECDAKGDDQNVNKYRRQWLVVSIYSW